MFGWLSRPGALPRMLPAWDGTRVLEKVGGVEDGSARRPGHPARAFTSVGSRCTRATCRGRRFCDDQVKGPFARWFHTHEVEPDGPDACYVIDDIEYALPLHVVTGPIAGWAVRRKIESVFRYRARVMEGDLDAHRRMGRGAAMHVLLSGASGFVGSRLRDYLTSGGHTVTALTRPGRSGRGAGTTWDPATGEIAPAEGGPADAVVHLAGDGIADGRWTAAKKQRLIDSRIGPTRRLCEHLGGLEQKPRVLVAASAIGFYGDRGDEELTEESGPGSNFLADLAQQWEAATAPAREAGIRVVNLRIGIVLHPGGGALGKMLLPFKLGGGGPLGSGRQYMSWISMDDLLDSVLAALTNEDLEGPVNAVAPTPVTNAEFAKTLGRVLRRPAFLPAPAFAMRLLLGEMADALLLEGARVMPRRLEEAEFRFRHPDLEGALRHLLGKSG